MASKKPGRRSAAEEPPGYRTVLPKTSLAKDVPEEDSEDNRPSKAPRSRTQKLQPNSSRREYGGDDSDEPPAEDRRGGKQKATARPSRRDDRRRRYDNGDDDRYGGSCRDHGNRARDGSESRSRSRSRHRTNATAMVKRGESSRAATKRDTRSRTDTGSSSRRGRQGHSEDEDEEVIKISRYASASFHELDPDFIDELCELLDVRAGKVKQWCERDLIRHDQTTGLLDVKRLVNAVDDDDGRKLGRWINQQQHHRQAAIISGHHHGQHRRYDGSFRHRSDYDHPYHDHHYHHHHHHHSELPVRDPPSSSMPLLSYHVRTGYLVVDDCIDCDIRGSPCPEHLHLALPELENLQLW